MTGCVRRRLRRALLPGLLLLGAAPTSAQPSSMSVEPEGSGWLVAGSRPQDYDVELEPEGGREGTLAASLKAIASSPKPGFVTLMRHVDSAPFGGSRVRLSAWVKAKEVAGWSGLWVRVDAQGGKRSLAFDNMEDRAIRGTRDWRRYEVVVDVQPAAARINYGILLDGLGQVWVDDFRLEIVGDAVPVTDTLGGRPAPLNLDFDHPPEGPPP